MGLKQIVNEVRKLIKNLKKKVNNMNEKQLNKLEILKKKHNEMLKIKN